MRFENLKVVCLLALLALVSVTARAQLADTYTAGAAVTVNTLVKISSNQVVPATISDTVVPVYIALNSAASGGQVAIGKVGQVPCVMDATNASFASQPVYITNSTTTATDCHASTTAPSAGTYVAGFIAATATTSGSTANVEVGGFIMPATTSGGFSVAGAGLYSPTASTVRRASVADVHLNSAPWFIADDLSRDPANFLNGQILGPIGYGTKSIVGTCTAAGTNTINAPSVAGYVNGWDIVTPATSTDDCLLRALQGSIDILPAPSSTAYTVDFAESNDTLANDYHAVGLANIAASGAASSFAGTVYDKIWCDVTDTATAGNWACHFSVGATQTNVTLSPAQTAVTGPTVIEFVVSSTEVDFYFGSTKVGCANSGGTGGCNAWTAGSLTSARLSPAWEALTSAAVAAKTGLYGWSAHD